MRIKLKAFPVVYTTARCVKHNCWVEILPKAFTDKTDLHITGASLTALQCQVGGEPEKSNCSHTWELSISGTGDITVTHP